MPSPPAKPAAGPDGTRANRRGAQRVVTPLVLQMHVSECGAACLGSVLAYFGRWVPLTELRSRCGVSRDGSTAAGILRAARHYGVEGFGRPAKLHQLRRLSLPLILFWEFNHFLILEGFDRDRFFLNDPASGRRTLSAAEFSRGFTGVALEFRPGREFERTGARPGLRERLTPWLRGAGAPVALAVASGPILAVLALVTPAALAIFVDRVLGEHEPWTGALAAALAASAVLSYGVVRLKRRWLGNLAIRSSVIAGSRTVSRLLRLPAAYFSHRLVGDLTMRVQSIDRIASGLSHQLLGRLIELAMSAVFLGVLLAYDPPLALLVLGLALLNAAAVRLIARARRDRNHALRREQGLLFGVGTLGLHHADTLRMTAGDDRFFARWGGHQARELAARQRFSEFGHLGAALPGLFAVLGNAAVLTLGATRVMAGDWTLGGLVGLSIVAAMFLAPVGRFAEVADDRQALEADLQRLEDINETPEAAGTPRSRRESRAIATLDGRLRLAGRVELRDVTFGHSPGRPALLQNISLVIEPGQRVAVVGPSGSGKSTLARLVSGLHEPWSGEILFDGRPRGEIPEEVLSRSVSMVDQHIVLFSASVRENITLWNPAVPDGDVVRAARDAEIHDEILSRPLGYAAEVDEDGANFSGGQRQRLEIARALVGSPTVLVLDEATSALDAGTEARIDDALRRRGGSCLIVAHRLSTVRDCDQILVLKDGAEVQRGVHEDLMADEGGLYRRLIRAG